MFLFLVFLSLTRFGIGSYLKVLRDAADDNIQLPNEEDFRFRFNQTTIPLLTVKKNHRRTRNIKNRHKEVADIILLSRSTELKKSTPDECLTPQVPVVTSARHKTRTEPLSSGKE